MTTAEATLTPAQLDEKAQTFIKWTHYFGIIGGVIQTAGAAIDNGDWLCTGDNATTKTEWLTLLEKLYNLIDKLNTNFGEAITTMQAGTNVTYTLTAYTMPTESFFPIQPNVKPTVIGEAWTAVKPGLEILLSNLNGEPALLETTKAIISNGEDVVSAAANLISSS